MSCFSSFTSQRGCLPTETTVSCSQLGQIKNAIESSHDCQIGVDVPPQSQERAAVRSRRVTCLRIPGTLPIDLELNLVIRSPDFVNFSHPFLRRITVFQQLGLGAAQAGPDLDRAIFFNVKAFVSPTTSANSLSGFQLIESKICCALSALGRFGGS